MLTCSKTYRGIPLAHRQHLHPGRCARIHGHSWTIRVTLACKELDVHGFVVDFGALGFIAEWIDAHLDHAIMFAEGDAVAKRLVEAAPEAFKVFWVHTASCECLAQTLRARWSDLLRERVGERAWIERLEVWEDADNAVSLQGRPG